MPETCLYKINFQRYSSMSFVFDEMHVIAVVEAPKGICFDTLESLCCKKIPGFWSLNKFSELYVRKLI